MIRTLRPVLWTALAAAALPAPETGRPEFAPVTDVPGLPRVLILGDSISIGYTLPLREALRGVANVHRPAENCESTVEGLAKLDRWLGSGAWDVIHFNWGLHDLKYVDERGDRVAPETGRLKVPIEEYGRNLEMLVVRLKKSGAQLIWRPTTPVPPGAFGRIAGHEERYNAVAAEIMTRHGIEIDDLNAFIRAERIPHVKPDDVHFDAAGSARLGRRCAAAIARVLQRGR